MNFVSLVARGFIIICALVLVILLRHLWINNLFHNKKGKKKTKTIWAKLNRPLFEFKTLHRRMVGWTAIIVLAIAICLTIYANFVEVNILRINQQTIKLETLKQSIKIAFVSDLQIGTYKKTNWTEKVVKKIEQTSPDIIIFGGDQINNGGTFFDESIYLEPIKNLTAKYPVYYVLGNHEYGMSSSKRNDSTKWNIDMSSKVIAKMQSFGAKILRDDLECLNIRKQKVCLYGIDDIWKKDPTFKELHNWNQKDSIIFITHNPDGILFWPKKFKKPDLTLAGHTHGGQIYFPLIGPVGRAGVELGTKYYRGLKDYQGMKIFTSVGAGESGGPLRFFTIPEVAKITLEP